MKKYLYGAAIQGIQDFIFKTNELKHIVGASELVDEICTKAFEEYYGKNGYEGVVVKAAGNIKYLYNTKEECGKAVLLFPQKVMQMAPGITISQAVVEMETDDNNAFGDAIDKLEKILKTQRNKPKRSLTLGLLGTKRANNTGLPVVDIVKNEFLDDSTLAKLDRNEVVSLCEKSFGERTDINRIAFDVEKITAKNDWIAVIHADGNGLGKVVQKVGKNIHDFKLFSEKLDTATKKAANAAFASIKSKFDNSGIIPLRPVVLSGDDLTVIIRGDLAIDYAKTFMIEFEKQTHLLLGNIISKYHVFEDNSDRLTACAGIAFIKSSYPFYYGYNLAEDLCKSAKNDAKSMAGENNLANSCLMFHKVQDSFVLNYKDIEERELKCSDESSFKAGPYYVESTKDDRYLIDDLIGYCKKLDKTGDNGVRTGIRQWISLRLDSPGKADIRKNRMIDVFEGDNERIVKELTDFKRGVCLAYDVLSIHSVLNQTTK